MTKDQIFQLRTKKNDAELARDYHGICVNYDHDTYVRLNREFMAAHKAYYDALKN